MLIYFGSSHNFIQCKLAKVLNYFIYLALEFQVMISDRGTINYLGNFHKISLNMAESVLNVPIIYIPMSGIDVVLGVQWL